MSMPAYIEVAVIGKDQNTVETITDGVDLFKSGIFPRYHLVSLSQTSNDKIRKITELNYDRVLFWVALDYQSKSVCQEAVKINESRPGFSRSFYKHLLPESIVVVTTRDDFIAITEKLWDAFVESS